MPPALLRSILVATDLGEGSDPVVASAADLAAATRAELHALTSFDLQPITFTGGDEAPSFPGRVAEAQRVLKEQIARTVPASVTVASQEAVIFVAHKAIAARAVDVSADLIVLGPHRARTGDAILGSTADRVIRTASVPVLVLLDRLSLPLRRVIAAIDLSAPARVALDHAVSWTAALGAGGGQADQTSLQVLHVVPRQRRAGADEAVVASELDREVDGARARTHRDAGAGGIEMAGQLRWAEDPAEEILRAARENGADLLVLGTHGRGAISRALIGSVASGVARRARCPVLLVPPAMWRREA